ncbi:MAG: hypothetical protein KF779_09130 [Hyphomonadaceae bacterium]|nr:hypothetical protein [Hyphomonadaceae bacterium]
MTDRCSISEEVIASIEFRFLIDGHLAARRAGQTEQANIYAHAAEGLVATALPDHADAIASVASRKGDGRSIGSALAQCLSPASAAAVCIVWLIRGARRPAIDALSEAFRDDSEFVATVKMLCRRVFEPTPVTSSTLSPPSATTRFETFAVPGR